MEIKDYETKHILKGFIKHMNNDLKLLFKKEEIKKRIEDEFKELRDINYEDEKEVSKEKSELNELIGKLNGLNKKLDEINKTNNEGSERELSKIKENVIRIKKILGATLRNFTAIVNKAVSIYSSDKGLINEKRVVDNLTESIVKIEEAGDLKDINEIRYEILSIISHLNKIIKLLEYRFEEL